MDELWTDRTLGPKATSDIITSYYGRDVEDEAQYGEGMCPRPHTWSR